MTQIFLFLVDYCKHVTFQVFHLSSVAGASVFLFGRVTDVHVLVFYPPSLRDQRTEERMKICSPT